jgi:hypothetical protein
VIRHDAHTPEPPPPPGTPGSPGPPAPPQPVSVGRLVERAERRLGDLLLDGRTTDVQRRYLVHVAAFAAEHDWEWLEVRHLRAIDMLWERIAGRGAGLGGRR